MKSSTGKILIIGSFIIAVNPLLFFFAVPVFMFGILYLITEKISLALKLAWIIFPILLWFPGHKLFMFSLELISGNKTQKIHFYFEDNFRGPAIIIPNMPCGQSKIKSFGIEKIYVPNNGIAFYKENIGTGIIKYKFFVKDKSGEVSELPVLKNRMYSKPYDGKTSFTKIGVWIIEGLGAKKMYSIHSIINYNAHKLIVSSKIGLENQIEFIYSSTFEHKVDSLVRICLNIPLEK